jgi:hypothetical protein
LDLDARTSPFQIFCENIVGKNGLLKWRIHSPDLDVIAMNDVSVDSGIFKTNHFVHVSLVGKSNFVCSCQIFTLSLQMPNYPSTNAINCTHVRFFSEIIMPKYLYLFSGSSIPTPHSTLDSKLIAAIYSLNIPVLKIDNDVSHHRFSVLSNDLNSASFVTLSGKRAACMDGKCRATCGKSRKVSGLGDDSSCQHLRAMNNHQELWMPLITEENNNKPPSVGVLN